MKDLWTDIDSRQSLLWWVQIGQMYSPWVWVYVHYIQILWLGSLITSHLQFIIKIEWDREGNWANTREISRSYLSWGGVLININKWEWPPGRSVEEKFYWHIEWAIKSFPIGRKLENNYKMNDKKAIDCYLSEYLGGYVSGSHERVMSRHPAGLNKRRADWGMEYIRAMKVA